MLVRFHFVHVDRSESFENHIYDRLQKIERFELNPMEIEVEISGGPGDGHVEIIAIEGRRKYRAGGHADDFYRASDMAVNKLLRQLSKERRRSAELNRRRPHLNREGHLALMNEQMEMQYSRLAKKAG